MKISIVVPAFNEERLLPETLARVRSASAAFGGWDTELVVCDNNSTDRTAQIAREAGASVVFEPVNQISRARNAGAARASGEWLVFVDADSHPSPELFGEVRTQIAAGRCIAGGATVKYDDPRASVRLAVGAWNAVSRTAKWAAGSFIFCETAAFRAVGGFSTELYAAEEIDLFRRLKRLARGARRTIVILHRNPIVTSGRKVKLYRWGELLAFGAKLILTGGRSLRRRESCFPWYDGRRD
ncbi:MAG TPA: glycosyltransferase [Burkholderiales bacterium]|nr:glycosyltransferase [Burkholderiales bacterium]